MGGGGIKTEECDWPTEEYVVFKNGKEMLSLTELTVTQQKAVV